MTILYGIHVIVSARTFIYTVFRTPYSTTTGVNLLAHHICIFSTLGTRLTKLPTVLQARALLTSVQIIWAGNGGIRLDRSDGALMHSELCLTRPGSSSAACRVPRGAPLRRRLCHSLSTAGVTAAGWSMVLSGTMTPASGEKGGTAAVQSSITDHLLDRASGAPGIERFVRRRKPDGTSYRHHLLCGKIRLKVYQMVEAHKRFCR